MLYELYNFTNIKIIVKNNFRLKNYHQMKSIWCFFNRTIKHRVPIIFIRTMILHIM